MTLSFEPHNGFHKYYALSCSKKVSNFHYSVCLKYHYREARISLTLSVTILARDILFMHPVFLKASNRFVNNVEGRIMVLWGRRRRRRQRQNGCVTSLRHHRDVRSLTNNIKDWHYYIPPYYPHVMVNVCYVTS